MQKNTICLNMIVKNESAVIERCLRSVYHIIDTWCIVDTGSTDGTQDIIRNFLKNKPGELIEKPWINFGHNRNESIKLAEKWGDWLFLIDADMILEDKGFDKSVLDKNLSGYSITQLNEHLEYYNPRILNADSDWRCIGVTHEYYAPEKKDKPFYEKFERLQVRDLNDGGSRGDKLPRDVSLLTRGLLDEPGNVRYMFYLGQSYKCMLKPDEAIYWYGRAAKESKWDEESWYSDYMVGFCMMMRKDELEKVSTHMLRSWIRRPTRLEPLYQLAMMYKNNNQWEQAYNLLKICSTIPKPAKDILFLEIPLYQWQVFDELAIAAARIGKFEESLLLYSELISEKQFPQEERSRIDENIQSIKTASKLEVKERTKENLLQRLDEWKKAITRKYSNFPTVKKDFQLAIIAACKGYDINIIEPWVESLKATGFSGKVFVVLYSATPELAEYFKSQQFYVCHDKEDGKTHVATQRFLAYAHVLENEIAKDVDYVLHTDIRDVIFQRNPEEWFKANVAQQELIYASAEGVTYRHEDWNGEGMQFQFGEKLFNEFIDQETLCSGVFGGRKEAFIDLCKMMYEMAFWSRQPEGFIDQHFYNVLIRKVFDSVTKIPGADTPFVANLGTLIAIPKQSPLWSTQLKTQQHSYGRLRKGNYVDNMLVDLPMLVDGRVCTPSNEPYVIVHQYDRYESWKENLLSGKKEKILTRKDGAKKLKIALCLSGQPRSLEKGFEYHKKNLLDHYDVDVFIHTWKNDDEELLRKLLQLYNPVSYVFESPLVGDFDSIYKNTPNIVMHPPRNTVSMLYSMYKSNELKIANENKKGMKYDWVVKSRTDYALNLKIPFEELQKDKLYIPNCRMVAARDFGNDQFAFGDSDVMNKRTSIYPKMKDYYERGIAMIGEDMLQAHLHENNLFGDNLIYVDMKNPFPPGKYNATRHSLIRDDYSEWKDTKK